LPFTRAELGDAAFAAACAEGRAMTLRQAVEYAVSQEESYLGGHTVSAPMKLGALNPLGS
jgi:hypothetical protein